MRDIDPQEAGARLKGAVSEAYGRPGYPRNQTQLSARSGVSRTVLDGWWAGTQPKFGTLKRVADALGVTSESLWRRWFGYEPPEPGLGRIADEIARLREAISAAGGGEQQTRDADAVVGLAQSGQPVEPEDDPPSVPSASSRRNTPGA